ncbi:hypothetical protein BG004_006643 [Podila humilis]|nr:hypothetical protein BG004_006643 [Podila humilis]
MSSLAVAQGDSELDYGPSPPPNIDAIIPGAIFQDEDPLPSFADGGYEPPRSTHSTGSGTQGNNNNNNNNNSNSINKGAEIEVNSTIQTILVSLGIAVGVMFLLGVVAAQFISHKNKRAAAKKRLAGEGDEKGRGIEGDIDDDGVEDDAGGSREAGRGKKRGLKKKAAVVMVDGGVIEEDHHDRITRFGEKHELTIESSLFHGSHGDDDADMNLGRRPSITGQLLGPDGPYSGGGMYNGKAPSSVASSGSHSSFRLSSSGNGSNNNAHLQSPKGGGIIGSVGIGAGGGGSNVHGSVGGKHKPQPMNMNLDNSQHNPRNTIVDVANIYSQRQAHTGGGDLHIGIPPSDQHQHPKVPYSHYSISPSSAGTTTENPFASPPLSAGSPSFAQLGDPFRTNSHSQASGSAFSSSPRSNDNSSPASQGVGEEEEDDGQQYASMNPFYSQHHTLGHDYFGHGSNMASELPSPPSGPAQGRQQLLYHNITRPASCSPAISTGPSKDHNSPPIVIHGASDHVHPMDMPHPSPTPSSATSPLSSHSSSAADIAVAPGGGLEHLQTQLSPHMDGGGGGGGSSLGPMAGGAPKPGSFPAALASATSFQGAAPTNNTASSPYMAPSLPRNIIRSSTTGMLSNGNHHHHHHHHHHQHHSSQTDRRSFAGVLPGRVDSTVNEGSAWYRKRASVIIPEGSAHVRLWGDANDGSGNITSTTPAGAGYGSLSSKSSSSSLSLSSSSTSPSQGPSSRTLHSSPENYPPLTSFTTGGSNSTEQQQQQDARHGGFCVGSSGGGQFKQVKSQLSTSVTAVTSSDVTTSASSPSLSNSQLPPSSLPSSSSASSTTTPPISSVARNGAAVFEGRGTTATSRSTRSRQGSASSLNGIGNGNTVYCTSPDGASGSIIPPVPTVLYSSDSTGLSMISSSSSQVQGSMASTSNLMNRAASSSRRGSVLEDQISGGGGLECPPAIAVTRRRGSLANVANNPNRQSYLDDYNEQRQQQQLQQQQQQQST